ncbi:MAG: GAF domain-containing protein [Elusimicrobia bacterium]|nr:GAF domain-containing protein [Elusimicrobiota bacterium]MDE2236794.1 GAF domain-containing protein [Elusimicrobiota bacterium]MDE2425372.1 GAF domain-containing protein [Elusimicrobiota bacterium]
MAQTEEALELLLEVGRLLSSKLDLSELLRTVLELASRVVDAETASVLLLDDKTQELYFAQALGLGDAAAKVRLRLGEGIAGTVAKTLQPEIINEVGSDPRWSAQTDAASGFKTRSILAVPMRVKGRLLGVVEAINKSGGPFSKADLRTLEGFAAQAAVAIDNARLFSSLTEERFKLGTIFTEMSDAAVLADPRGDILMANPAARQLLGLGEEPTSLRRAFEPLVLKPALPALLSGGVTESAFEARRKKPTALTLSGRATRIEVGWLLILRDVTEESRKEDLKRTFLSLISHKLKTPLASITGYAEVLQDELAAVSSKPIFPKAVGAISQQGRKLSALVDKLLLYTKLESSDWTPELRPCALDDAVDAALKQLQEWLSETGADISRERPDEALPILADEDALIAAVKNLVENAVKFDAKPRKRVVVRTLREGNDAALRVKDNGCGIPPEEQRRVFSRFHQVERYFTGQVDGWGLGLPYVKKVVDSHGGSVELRSTPARGTTVTVRLPLRGKTAKTAGKAS